MYGIGGMQMTQPGTFYFDHGNQAVILLHAFASGPIDVRLLARRLESENYSVYAPMFTGHGTADFSDIINNGSPEVWLQDAEDAIEFVKSKGKTEVAIFGISLGGIFAAKILEEHPELTGGGSFGSPIVRNGPSKVRGTFLQMAKANYQRFGVDNETINNKLKWLDDNIDPLLAKINDFANGVAEDLAKIHQPYFIGQGSKDEIVDPQSGGKLKDRLVNSRDVSFHVYPEASHMITVNSAHPDLEADLKSFLKKIY